MYLDRQQNEWLGERKVGGGMQTIRQTIIKTDNNKDRQHQDFDLQRKIKKTIKENNKRKQ
jgi:hypothetical protein